MDKSVISSNYLPLQVIDLPTANDTRLLVVGKWGPKFKDSICGQCPGFERVVTRRGVISCSCVRSQDNRPPLPQRPQPHERDGRQPASEPARPHPRRSALLVG